MTKWALLILLAVYIQFHSYAQDKEANFLTATSETYLHQKVDFSSSENSLEQVLQQLEKSFSLKFSFSNNRIKHIVVAKQTFQNKSIETILQKLLQNTGYSYLLVGRVVVIIQEKKIDKDAVDS